MTAAEYDRLYIAARDSFPSMTRGMIAELKQVYLAAADQAAEAVRSATLSGLSELTIESRAAIDAQLRAGAQAIAQATEDLMPGLITEGYEAYRDVDIRYMMEAVKAAGAEALVSAEGLAGAAVGVNEGLIRAMVTRTYPDGYTFSRAIWGDIGADQLPLGIFGDYQYRMANAINAGFAQGRSTIQVAKDLQVYVKDGKTALVNRYGALERGTAEFSKRISDRVDWRALRLARSELYASLQTASVQAGVINPGTEDLFDWRLTPGVDHDTCICPELAAGGPYKAEDVPSFPHPNCYCNVVPHLRDHDSFVDDLTRWSDGDSVPYLGQWYTRWYLPGQAA